MSTLSIRDLHKSYGAVRVLAGAGLDAADGTSTAILGPSGCGKTTLLRLVAGFDRPDAGTIVLAGREVTAGRRGLAPDKRDIGYVAQEGALFPHLTVHANIAYGLSRRTTTASARRSRVGELLELVSLDQALSRRYPHELSGGQQQRVALARALARRPALVLLDEPFSSLDTALRAATRAAVAAALRAAGVTTLLVTHDPAEALALADQVAVMHRGAFAQAGPARDVYARPADLDTARLLGPGSILPGTVTAGAAVCALGVLPIAEPRPDGDADVFVRPGQVRLGGTGAPATVVAAEFLGADTMLTLRLADGSTLDARVDGTVTHGVGTSVTVDVIGAVHAYPRRVVGERGVTAAAPGLGAA
ncbi:ABC transporter ATP-binding protein [Dactylosporangium sucinum]|uniref:ABC-type quaternary amine transporter n=1 Tax=Dactylosporangium sucinum TaxID=1424081 RepID=A0A917TL18_9ACTN|nr:ABC transporter ATP-binding protein [Dactylosporangium sucinum]GGM26137.1 ABC transporter [Dactylosporangium sucinum]